MTQTDHLQAMVNTIGKDVKTLFADCGVLSNLSTVDKSNLVSAVNEVKAGIPAPVKTISPGKAYFLSAR